MTKPMAMKIMVRESLCVMFDSPLKYVLSGFARQLALRFFGDGLTAQNPRTL
jgi:hypothetical protein